MAKPSSKPAKTTKTQTYPNAAAAIAGAKRRGEKSITFKLQPVKKAR